MKGFDMRQLKTFTIATLAVISVGVIRAQGQRDSLVWAPVPTAPNGWVAPNKPHTKLPDLLAAHKNQASWREPVVRDTLLQADYIQMAAGTKTPRQFQPDNPIWWIVQAGEARFTIEGQEPITASKGCLLYTSPSPRDS